MIRFKFESTYMGESDYTVYGDGEPYRICWRHHSPSEYERKIFNGTDEEFEKQVVAKVGSVSLYSSYKQISQPVYEAFILWQAQQREEDERKIHEFWEKTNAPWTLRVMPERLSTPIPMYFDLEAKTFRTVDWYQSS